MTSLTMKSIPIYLSVPWPVLSLIDTTSVPVNIVLYTISNLMRYISKHTWIYAEMFFSSCTSRSLPKRVLHADCWTGNLHPANTGLMARVRAVVQRNEQLQQLMDQSQLLHDMVQKATQELRDLVSMGSTLPPGKDLFEACPLVSGHSLGNLLSSLFEKILGCPVYDHHVSKWLSKLKCSIC